MIDFSALERANVPLNAFLDLDRSASGGSGPLADVTVGVKANIAVAGLPFHAGLAGLRDRIAKRDAEVVTRLRNAGAIILGTLNMEEAALGAKTDNPHFGPVHNPNRIGFSPGGSSGGSGAAVAASLCDVALGTDTMGSVRIPAAHCGVYGFKPATGRVSQDGLEPADTALDAIGPLARNLDLLERVARVISDFGEGAIGGQGAVLASHDVEVDPPVVLAFNTARRALGRDFAEVELGYPNSRIRFAGFIKVSKFLALRLAGVDEISPHLTKLLKYGPARSASDWAEDQEILTIVRKKMQDIVTQQGFLIMPTVPNAAFDHAEREPPAQADFTCLANIAGLPALSLPAGSTDGGMPVGVQLVCRPGDEAGLFALARLIDDRLGAYRAPAPLGE